MSDQGKTKEHRLAEKCVAELEGSEARHKQKEKKMLKALKYAESIIETVREPLLVLDSDLKVVQVNRSFYDSFKVTPEETIGKFVYDLGNRQWDIPGLRTLLEDILPKDNQFDGYGVEHEFSNIGYRSMILNARRIYQEGVGAQMVLLAIEDITERKRAEGKVQALNQELERHITELQIVNEELKTFSYAVSHDLKAPLITIGGFSRKLLEKYGDSLDEKGQQYLRIINTSSMKMEELIRDLLDFFSSGREPVNLSSLKVEKMVREVFDQLQKMYPKRTIHLHVETMPDAKGDEAMITQVLVNLLSNAIKYTRPREITDIRVGGWSEAERNVYYVKDNGIGFPMEYADKLLVLLNDLNEQRSLRGPGSDWQL